MECIQFSNEKKYIRDFVNFPCKLYIKTAIESKKEIKSILEDKHPLCKYFTMSKFLIYKKKEVVARFALTIYPNSDDIYIGFFECINKDSVASLVFKTAYDYAKKNNFKRIIGPIDASFWLKYRLKINKFDGLSYTSEPYNKDYYYKMFLDNNYKVVEHYTSNVYRPLGSDYKNDKFKKRYEEFVEKGYIIKNIDKKDYDKELADVYYLLTDLYKSFPVYNHISKEDFMNIFYSYKSIINPTMVKLAYYNEKICGFFISIPNYSSIVYKLNIRNILKILKIRKNPSEYILIYMGADRKHAGLGSAITYSIIEELKKNDLPSIGALTKDGKVTQTYAKDKIESRYEYVLLQTDII